MKSEIYPFDTEEHQSNRKPYGFVEFQPNFFDVYLNKRKGVIRSLRESIKESSFSVPTNPSIILKELQEFESIDVIREVYHRLDNNEQLDETTLNHFWRILKKADIRKLTRRYNKRFRNTSREDLGLEGHALLALTLGMYAVAGGEGYLQSLSTSLKQNDLIISRREGLTSLEQAITLASLELEVEQTEKFREKILERDLVYVPNRNLGYEESKPSTKITLDKLGMLLQEGNRSKAYLQALVNSGLHPNFVLFLKDPKYDGNLDEAPLERKKLLFDPNISEIETLDKNNIPYKLMYEDSCDSPNVVRELERRSEEFFIFSGRGILKQSLEAGKKLIHTHPGKLPQYRGSTCHFYSVLAGDGWHCTSFIMEPQIDQGEVITTKEFPLPGREIDDARTYDPYSRSMVMVETIRQLAETGTLKTEKQDLSKGVDYYIIHPVLGSIRRDYLDSFD
jgi:methionyl-tRNA formyltransferase|tara:strand:+ start:367 stop:1719 length:1353 start_codon:yes stop_codon:yes gene_type:complete